MSLKNSIIPGLLGLLSVLSVAPTVAQQPKITYPQTRQGAQVDDYHGVKVADPYRWLEDDVRTSKKVAGWVAEENKITSKYLDAIPQRQKILKRLTELWNYEKYSSPMKEDGRYFYLKNNGLQNQDVLYVMEKLDGPARVLLDPNAWSADGTKALAGLSPSDDGKYLAYGMAEAGSDWQTWRVLDIESGKHLVDRITWIKETAVSWTKDGRGFFYSRLDEPPPGEEFHAKNLNSRICYHRLGTPQTDDVLVYALPEHPDWSMMGVVTEDGRYLVITIAKGTDEKFRVAVKDLAEPYGMPVDLVKDFKNDFSFIGNDGPVLFFRTDLDAPRKRVIAIDLRIHSPLPLGEAPGVRGLRVRQIIPQAEATLRGVSFVGNLLIASYLNDVKPQVKLFTPEGKFVREVEFPGIGSVGGFGGKRTDTETFYTFMSFATPPCIYQYDLITGKSTLLRRAEVKFNPENYAVKQVFYHSKDGTRVPMFLAYEKGLTLDGSNPTLLYGYGGFNIPELPRFSVGYLVWMEMGGVLAIPNLRGGGEYGEDWHRAGTKLQKQNVFDDFIAAAEWLIREKYTAPKKLAVFGGSNGGLLVGAVEVQRPELFGACLPAVGVMDMLRFHLFTEGRQWVDDYGCSDNPKEFKALFAYSPYHNIKPGVAYPATLILTADTDDRVIPGHSFKFTAALQRAQAGPAPILIRIETRAGHGAGKPTAKRLAETADLWAFLVKNLKMAVP
jgi:prolyl oligopeptidase